MIKHELINRKFTFSNAEIQRAGASRAEWHRFVRTREAELALQVVNGRQFSQAIELGAGDGGQSCTIANVCGKLICTDISPESQKKWIGGTSLLDRKESNVEYRIIDAQDLSAFDDSSFDLVYSSNMLEHVPQVKKCLAECKRVLRPDGVMLHTMPGRAWKLFHHFLMYPRLLRPHIHGVSSSHARELYEFGPKVWVDKFNDSGFSVSEIVGMPFYVGHGNHFLSLTKLGNRVGLSATFLFVVEHNQECG